MKFLFACNQLVKDQKSLTYEKSICKHMALSIILMYNFKIIDVNLIVVILYYFKMLQTFFIVYNIYYVYY